MLMESKMVIFLCDCAKDIQVMVQSDDICFIAGLAPMDTGCKQLSCGKVAQYIRCINSQPIWTHQHNHW